MHLVYLSREYPPEGGFGDIGTYTRTVARLMASRGHRVTVIALALGAERVVQDGPVRVHRVAVRARRYEGTRLEAWARRDPTYTVGRRETVRDRLFGVLDRLFGNRFDCPAYARRVLRELRVIHGRDPVDLVEAPESGAEAGACLESGPAPVVLRLHGSLRLLSGASGGSPGAGDRAQARGEADLLARAPVLTAPSRLLVDATRAYVPGLAPVTVIPHPISYAGDRLVDERLRDPHLVVHMGRLSRRIGSPALLRAVPAILREHPRARFLFAGPEDAPDLAQDRDWKTLKRSLGGPDSHIRFLGHLDPGAMRGLAMRAAVAVFPSRFESFPYAPLEAALGGAALVISDRNGTGEILAPDGARTVSVGDDAALARSVAELLGDRSGRWDSARRARERVLAACGPETVGARLEACYRSLGRAAGEQLVLGARPPGRADVAPAPASPWRAAERVRQRASRVFPRSDA